MVRLTVSRFRVIRVFFLFDGVWTGVKFNAPVDILTRYYIPDHEEEFVREWGGMLVY